MKQSKNYIGFVNDHSGSMKGISNAAMNDYNATVATVKDAASRESLDTIVSVVGIGLPMGAMTERQITVSNPHVLEPMNTWPTTGGTPLYDGIADIIKMHQALPDAHQEHVSFLIMITTDGHEMHSRSEYSNPVILRALIEQMQNTGRWTFVFRVPEGARDTVKNLGVPADNIQEWHTSAAGMQAASKATTAAVDTYMTMRSTGAKATGGFFAEAKNINVSKLNDVSSQYKLYVTPDTDADDGMMISSFILRHRMKYLKGAAFYQLVKTESKVGPDKLILIQERTTGKIYEGIEARDMLGIPRGQNARVHPGQLEGYNIFIQSTSWNRKLPKGTGVLYNDKLGTEFTQEEIDRFTLPAAPKVVPSAPLSAMLPSVNNTSGKPVKSTMTVNKAAPVFYNTRDDARRDKANGANYIDLGSDKPKGQRFQKV